jgi:diaminohydroxyphosphoribosylaminopyrimidine deaminase/5-amino-6-(5-phosphoribosylamino)uracil reductase
MVGCVIVYEGQIIGEGWHHHPGGPHAEVMAINTVKEPELLTKSTLYVSLEPCAHHGRTPPCSLLIQQKGLKKVVIGTVDPFAKVNGAGIEQLRASGIEVITGVLEKECQALNQAFFTFHQKRRPYISLKWAQTADGFMDKIRGKAEKGVRWISSENTKILSHQLRARHAAILVGANTVVTDDPSLTVREVAGPDPLRVIIDPNSKVSAAAKVFKDPHYLYFSNRNRANLKACLLNEQETVLKQVLDQLYKLDIQSVLIEGGAFTLNSFIKASLWDEAWVYQAPSEWQKGLAAPRLKEEAYAIFDHGSDQVKIYQGA